MNQAPSQGRRRHYVLNQQLYHVSSDANGRVEKGLMTCAQYSTNQQAL